VVRSGSSALSRTPLSTGTLGLVYAALGHCGTFHAYACRLEEQAHLLAKGERIEQTPTPRLRIELEAFFTNRLPLDKRIIVIRC